MDSAPGWIDFDDIWGTAGIGNVKSGDFFHFRVV